MRKLASVKRISSISQIEGKDRIVLAGIDGWNVIVKKGEFQVGDLCVYIEIDSVLPERPEFEFLRSKNFVIKTMKMGGVISQGICFPLSILPEGNYEDGQDVTELLGIKQYEKTMDLDPASTKITTKKTAKMAGRFSRFGKAMMRFSWYRRLRQHKEERNKDSSNFPSFISKTDEVRIQNIPSILQDKTTKWVATEKVDGQSGTFALVRHRRKVPIFEDRFEFIVCSRNKRLPEPDDSSYWSVAKMYNIEGALRQMIGKSDWVAIQGEVIGPKIQKNKYKVSGYDMFVFNLIYPYGRYSSKVAKQVCEMRGLKFVPILETNITLPDTVDEVLSFAHGKSVLTDSDTLREGIVFRSADGLKSFKAVDPQFLLKYDE